MLNKSNFEAEVLNSDIPVLVDFHASWCGPCQMMAPVFEKVSKDFEGKIKFEKLSTEEEPEIANKYEVRSIPCVILFNKGKEVNRFIGFRSEDELKEEITNLSKDL